MAATMDRYVTWSREVSHMSAIFNFDFSSQFTYALKMLHFDPNCIKIGHLIAEIWQIVQRSNNENKRNCKLLPCDSKLLFPTSDSFPLIMSHNLTVVYPDFRHENKSSNFFYKENDFTWITGTPAKSWKSQCLRHGKWGNRQFISFTDFLRDKHRKQNRVLKSYDDAGEAHFSV